MQGPPAVNISDKQVSMFLTASINRSVYHYSVSASRRTTASPAKISSATITGSKADLSGTAAGGASITVVASDGTKTLPYSTTAAGGNWSISSWDISTLTNGSITFTAQATGDPFNNASVAVVTTAKNTPVHISSWPATIGPGQTTAVLTGTASPGSSITLTAAQGTHIVTIGCGKADSNANWSCSIDVSSFNDGSLNFTVAANDNVGTSSQTVTAFKETGSPVPVVSAISPPFTNTQPLSYSVRFSVPVTDLSPSGVTITAPIADTGLTTTVQKVDPQNFTVMVSRLVDNGTHAGDGQVSMSIKAGAVSDAAGKTNIQSNIVKVNWDTTPPGPLTIIEFPASQNRASFSGTAGHALGDNLTVTVVVCATNVFPCVAQYSTSPSAPVNSSTGSWTALTTDLGQGTTHWAQATQTDQAGNVSTSLVGPFTT
jgi:hypothetical protein